ncbi:Nn.00g117040.m01.CDS01 [Neocucurbitaria sp. VM-36]
MSTELNVNGTPVPTNTESGSENEHNGGLQLHESENPIDPHPNIVTLNIGGRKFTVARDTLRESKLFRLQLSDNYTWTPEADGSYFLDADPDLFVHILRFMRRPSAFPLFYNSATGFDYDLYNRLEVEAEYFQLDALHAWIKEKKYLQAVKVSTGYPVMQDLEEVGPNMYQANRSDDWHVIPRTRKVYLCPRQIHVHRGHPELCGAACHRRQAEQEVVYEDEASFQIVRVGKEIVFDEKVCRVE